QHDCPEEHKILRVSLLEDRRRQGQDVLYRNHEPTRGSPILEAPTTASPAPPMDCPAHPDCRCGAGGNSQHPTSGHIAIEPRGMDAPTWRTPPIALDQPPEERRKTTHATTHDADS